MASVGGILDVIVGLSFVYFLLSLFCSGVNELLAWAIGLRCRTLRAGIQKILDDPCLDRLAQRIHDHPLVHSLSHQGRVGRWLQRTPSYIPANSFVLALLDTLGDPGVVNERLEGEAAEAQAALLVRQRADSIENVKKILAGLPEASRVRRQLELYLDEGMTDVAEYRRRLEAWFEQGMDRLSGAYKRRAQLITAAVAVAVAVGSGVDSWVVANALMRDGALRQATLVAAVDASRASPAVPRPGGADEAAASARMVAALARLDALDLPIGMSYLRKAAPPSDAGRYWLLRGLGMLFTGFAAALGAPFWFDLICRIINLRTSGPQPTKR